MLHDYPIRKKVGLYSRVNLHGGRSAGTKMLLKHESTMSIASTKREPYKQFDYVCESLVDCLLPSAKSQRGHDDEIEAFVCFVSACFRKENT